MCAPAVIAALVGSAVQMKKEQEAADYHSAVDRNNARVAGYQRDDAIQRGAYDARRTETAGNTITAAARAEIEGNGIDSTSGSAAAALTASRVNAAADATRIRANAAREAWGFGNEEQDLLATSRFRKESGYLGALGTGVSGIGSAAGAYAQYKQAA